MALDRWFPTRIIKSDSDTDSTAILSDKASRVYDREMMSDGYFRIEGEDFVARREVDGIVTRVDDIDDGEIALVIFERGDGGISDASTYTKINATQARAFARVLEDAADVADDGGDA